MAPPNKLVTLVFVQEPGRVLLGMKKRGLGEGRWNGFGGKVEEGESIEEGAIRETQEESGLAVTNLDKAGVIIFEFLGQPQLMECHVFRTTSYSGHPVETDEMRPQWFKNSDIPFDNMWPADSMWYPHLLTGKQFDAYIHFEGHDRVLEFRLSQRNTQSLPESNRTITIGSSQ